MTAAAPLPADVWTGVAPFAGIERKPARARAVRRAESVEAAARSFDKIVMERYAAVATPLVPVHDALRRRKDGMERSSALRLSVALRLRFYYRQRASDIVARYGYHVRSRARFH